jgi:hypothetical protein
MKATQRAVMVTIILASAGLPSAVSAEVLNNPLGNATICSLFVGILNAFMILGAPIAVVFVIIAGAKFVLARGKSEGPNGLTAAKSNLLWTLVGIAIFFGAIVITQVIFKTVTSFLSNNNQTPLECQI